MIKTFTVKTEKAEDENFPKLGNRVRVIDNETGAEVFPMSAKISIEHDEILTLTMTVPVSGLDLTGVLIEDSTEELFKTREEVKKLKAALKKLSKGVL